MANWNQELKDGVFGNIILYFDKLKENKVLFVQIYNQLRKISNNFKIIEFLR